nr:MAG TPA: hypothetical protein [Caudoviricetes sp.]
MNDLVVVGKPHMLARGLQSVTTTLHGPIGLDSCHAGPVKRGAGNNQGRKRNTQRNEAKHHHRPRFVPCGTSKARRRK